MKVSLLIIVLLLSFACGRAQLDIGDKGASTALKIQNLISGETMVSHNATCV